MLTRIIKIADLPAYLAARSTGRIRFTLTKTSRSRVHVEAELYHVTDSLLPGPQSTVILPAFPAIVKAGWPPCPCVALAPIRFLGEPPTMVFDPILKVRDSQPGTEA